MRTNRIRNLTCAIVAGLAALVFGGSAAADPPSRVARLGYVNGAVSFSPAGENDWVLATINRPLTPGDRLWTDAGARGEIQVGGAMIRIAAGTGVSLLNLDDQIVQLQLTQGTLNVRVRRFERGQTLEIDTPNLAFTLRQPGEFRITVDPDGSGTEIVMRRGQGEAYGEGAAYVVDSRQPYRFTGTGLRDYQPVAMPGFDEFDSWSSARDRSYDSSVSARYVSPDVIGYQDLDANGSWRADGTYGNVWFPTGVSAGWAPYQDGHWAWVDPWGWTWIDAAPWGFAVSHYGRWSNFGGAWGWVPGPVRTQAYYAPALVVFVGGNNFQLAISGGNVGGVAWFPLGPRDVYRPSYPVSRGYFENVNRSNTVINNTVINNYYNNSDVTNVVYANRQVPGAIVAVPTTAFVQSQPVSRNVVRVPREIAASAPVAALAAVAPVERSVHGTAAAGSKPPARVFERPVVARSAPPAAPVGFAAQQQQLAEKPGRPLDATTRSSLRPADVAPAPAVNVVAPTQVAAPTSRPPSVTPDSKPGEARDRGERAGKPAAPAAGAVPATTPATVSSPKPQEQRAIPEQQGKGAERARPVTPTPADARPDVPVAAPPSKAQEQRAIPEPRGKGAERTQPTPPAAPPQATPPMPAPAPSAVPKAPAAQPVEPRGERDARERPAKPAPAPSRAPTPVPEAPAASAAPPPAARPAAPSPQAAPNPPAAQERAARGKPAPSTPAAEPRGSSVVPTPPPSAQPAQPPAQERKPAAGKSKDDRNDRDEQKREDSKGKPKE